MHGRADPGRSGRPRTRARAADSGRRRSSCPPTSARKTGARRRRSTSWCARSRVRRRRRRARRAPRDRKAGGRRCNLLGPTALGFRHRDDVREITQLLGTARRRRASRRAAGRDARRPRAPRRGRLQRRAVSRNRRPRPRSGSRARSASRARRRSRSAWARRASSSRKSRALAGVDPAPALAGTPSRLPWYSRSVDSTYLTGKRVFVFGDATHAVAAARVAAHELGFTVVGLGTYSREFAREVRAAAQIYGVEPLITDDYLEVEAKVAELQPELVLGTQMERHIAKRLGIPCAVISAPVHVQDFPGALLAADGLRGRQRAVRHLGASADDGARGAPDHDVPRRLRVPRRTPRRRTSAARPRRRSRRDTRPRRRPRPPPPRSASPVAWAPEAEKELAKIPFFVRGKARRNTERFAAGQRRRHRSPSRPSTMPKRTSAADARPRARRASSRWTATWRARRSARTQRLVRELPGLTLSVHAAAEWGRRRRRARALHRRHRARGDIVIATMLFMEDHFLPVLPALHGAARRTATRWSCCMSAARSMRLTRMGRFSDGRRASGGALAFLKRLRGSARTARTTAGARADDDAAADPADPALHPRHRPGRARLLPDAAVLAGGIGGERRATWSASWSTATPTARAGRCAARSGRRRRSIIPTSASTIRVCRPHRRAVPTCCRAPARAAPSACC